MFKTLTAFCCVLMLGLTLAPDTAEAKRLGGGGSFGKSFFTPKKATPKPQPAPAAAPKQSGTTAAKAKPGMGGMLGGLLAGGLLAALFFGGAFDGIQIMDVLIIAVIAFVIFKLFARKAASRPQYAGHPRVDTEPAPRAEPQARTTAQGSGQGFQSGFNWGGQGADTETVELPSWFNERAFLDGAKGHFAQLQQAWSQNDLQTISSYCSTELYQALEAERAKLGDVVLDNDLVSVLAELIGYREKDQQAQISVLFSGWMREGSGAETTEFREVWHLTRDLSEESADWFIVGIDQA